MWYAVYQKADGELYSLGTVLAGSLPSEYAVKELLIKPDLTNVIWDRAKLNFVPRPPDPPDLVLDAIKGLPDLDTSTMTQAQLLSLIVKALKFLVKRELRNG